MATALNQDFFYYEHTAETKPISSVCEYRFLEADPSISVCGRDTTPRMTGSELTILLTLKYPHTSVQAEYDHQLWENLQLTCQPICKSLWMHVMYLGPFVHLRRELYRSQTDPKYKNSKNSIYSFIPIYMSRTVLYFGDKFQSICIFIFPGIIIQLNLLPHIFLDGNKSMPFGFSSLRTPFKRKK